MKIKINVYYFAFILKSMPTTFHYLFSFFIISLLLLSFLELNSISVVSYSGLVFELYVLIQKKFLSKNLQIPLFL